MLSLSQRGIASLAALFLIFAGIAAGVYLVSQQTDLFPEAANKNSQYSLKQYPSADINLSIQNQEATPSSSYALDDNSYNSHTIYVKLFDKKDREASDKKLTYTWSIDDSSIASINPYCDPRDKPYIKKPHTGEASVSSGGYGTSSATSADGAPDRIGIISSEKGKQKADCPENYAYIEPLSEGETKITVTVSKSNSSPLAKAVFNLNVVTQDPSVICTSDSNCKEGEYCMPGPCPMTNIYCDKAPCPSISCPAICVSKPTAKPSCIPRPACLDSKPACKRPEPAQGWCDGGKACTKDARLCSDGSYVSRDPNNNCNFAACPGIRACPEDVRVCPDGSNVYRTQPSCNFAACP